MAIDPVFITVPDVAEFRALGGEASLSRDERDLLAAVRQTPAIDYAGVRRLKQASLRRAFDRFVDHDWSHSSARANSLRAFISEQGWWLEEYALFRAIHAHHGECAWTDWPAALQQRDPAALEQIRRELAREILYYEYLQWLAARQWTSARARTPGVALFGDLAFMVDADSADVWARQHDFRLDVGIGAPPDAFSATGQHWGNPLYRWDVIEASNFEWLRARSARMAALFDGYRVDHLVGFFRTFAWPKDGSTPFFTPDEEPAQMHLGERLLNLFREPGAAIIAEDLGTVPDFVRATLARLGVPGFRVFRWERHWHSEGQPYRDPAEYPAVSVAASGTHDTEPVAVWWDALSADEKRKVRELPMIQRLAEGVRDERWVDEPFTPEVRDVLLEVLFASGSDLLLLPVQDAFGWRDRINEPATVSDRNWRYRLPWPSDRFDEFPEARERQATLRSWSERYDRLK
jgi:4-alpha-glucanotransferase